MNVFLTIALTLGLLMVPVFGMMNGAAAEAAVQSVWPMDKIKLHCPKAKVLDGLTANGGVNVEGWVQKLGYGR